MTTPDNTGAQASVSEAVVDDNAAKVTTDSPKPVEAGETETETTEAETTETPVEGAEVVETEEEKKTKSKLRREKQKAHVAALEAEVVRLSEIATAAERNKPVADALGPKPDRAKYDDEAEYAADLAAWKVEERITARQTKAHETTTSTVRNDSAAAKMNLFKERAMALTDRYPDIEAKVFKDDTLPMSATMAGVLMATDKGPEVAYWLSANRTEAQRIKSMQPDEQAFELGRIAATIDLPKPRTETKAPPPPSTVSGTVKGPSKSPENMSQAEYVKWRSNGGGEKRTG